MRPTIQVLDPDLIPKILAEAKQILAELGIEVRGCSRTAWESPPMAGFSSPRTW